MKDPAAHNGTVFPAQARLVASYKVSVNTSQTLTQLGITLPDGAIGIEIRVEGSTTVRVNTKAAATAANGGVAQYDTMSIWDTKDNLNLLQFFTGSATDVSVFVYTGE